MKMRIDDAGEVVERILVTEELPGFTVIRYMSHGNDVRKLRGHNDFLSAYDYYQEMVKGGLGAAVEKMELCLIWRDIVICVITDSVSEKEVEERFWTSLPKIINDENIGFWRTFWTQGLIENASNCLSGVAKSVGLRLSAKECV